MRELGEGTSQGNEDVCACKNSIYIGPLLAVCPIQGVVQGLPCGVSCKGVLAPGTLGCRWGFDFEKCGSEEVSLRSGRLAFGVCVVGRTLCLSKKKWRGARISVLSSQARRVGLGDGRDDYHNAQEEGSRPPQRDHTRLLATHFDGMHVLFSLLYAVSWKFHGEAPDGFSPQSKTKHNKAVQGDVRQLPKLV